MVDVKPGEMSPLAFQRRCPMKDRLFYALHKDIRITIAVRREITVDK
jgi:hypothetical protein